MRLRWDESKRQLVLSKRNIDFTQLELLLCLPYLEDCRSDEPEQYRLIGLAADRLLTFIVEYRYDELGEYIWVVTAWSSTTQEKRAYAQLIQTD
ncbi:MAG: hypothetical protein KDD44_08575 [Bdellovibrionales bacterium]|nr:hypothetical protein [Bdellovibrionales bacterium]